MTEPSHADAMDGQILLDFFDESTAGLESVAGFLVELESRQDDLGLISSIFRPVHSLKGNAAFFGLMNVKKLAHEMESILDLLRKRQARVTPEIMSALFEGIDFLKEMLRRAKEGGPEVADPASFKILVDKIKGLAKATTIDTAGIWAAMVDKLDRIAIRLGKDDKHVVTELESIISDIKALAPAPIQKKGLLLPREILKLQALLEGKLDQNLSAPAAQVVQDLFTALRAVAPDGALKDSCGEALRIYGVFMSSAVGFDDLCRETLLAMVNRAADKWPATGVAPAALTTEKPTADAGQPSDSPVGDKKVDAHKTMRVSEKNIDNFLEYVGELLVVGDMFHHIERSMASSTADPGLIGRFRTVNETFKSLSDNLRKSIMSIRKVSVKTLLQRAPKIARDVAQASGKQIVVEITGEDTEIDKCLVDLLDAPLTHMIRNSADHGIEPPEERKRAGKDPKGVIRLGVKEDDRFVEMSVADDGRGLNYEEIQKKAESMGLIEPGKALTEDDVIHLLFAPGVSTAKVVTDVSGRGVGMDVVKQAIEGAGGHIRCSSTRGAGSTFVVRVPRTVATEIVQGFLVLDGEGTYVLPMENIQETVSAEAGDIKTVADKGLFIMRHDRLYPVCRLSAVFEGGKRKWDLRERYTLVMIEAAGNLFAMAVDEVLGIQQMVVRKIEGEVGKPVFVSGGAIMGDGNVAMVVDLTKLFGHSGALGAH